MASTIARHPRLVPLAATGVAVGIACKFFIADARADSPSTPPRVFGGGPALFSLPLDGAEMVNHNTRRLRFRFSDGDAVSGLPLTSAVLTFSWPRGRWLPVVRPYTPVSSADDPGHLDLLVKQYPDGKSSTHLHSLAPGQSLFFVACLKGYQWKPNVFPHVALIAGGAGITPIFQLAQGILGNPDDRTAVTLVFGVNSDRDVLFKDEFDDYERRFPGRFRAVYVVSDPATASPHRKGRVTRELLSDILPSEARHDTTNVFVCGPPAMEKSLVGDGGVLQGLGFRKHQIHTF